MLAVPMKLSTVPFLRHDIRRVADVSRLVHWLLLSAVLHLVLIAMFAEVDWTPEGLDGAARDGALTVRLRLRWAKPTEAPPVQDIQRQPSVAGRPVPPRVEAAPPAPPAPVPLPRITALPLPSIDAPTMTAPAVAVAPLLSEPPPLPRVVAEPLPRTEVPVMRALPQGAAALVEPPPLPRIEAEALTLIGPTAAPVMRAMPMDAVPLAEPPTLSDSASPPPEIAPAPTGSTITRPVAPAVVVSPPGPARLDFGPRRSVDPDLAALVGEPLPTAPLPPAKSPGLDLDATRALARNLHRAPATTRPSPALDLSSPKPDAESTLGRAIGNAAQPDCRAAYAGLGLLGIPFLLFDTVTDTGCRW